MRIRLPQLTIIAMALLLCANETIGQTAVTVQPSPISEIDTYVKVIVAILTGVATLFGLPIALLTYRKTRAEITKIELEANALREKQVSQGERSKDEDGNIHILVERSSNTHIQVLADPRFLGPLLLLLDFIFTWILLTLASYILSIFRLGIFYELTLIILALALLLPLAKQVIRVRSVLSPNITQEEAFSSMSQTRVIVYMLYLILALSSLVFGVVLILMLSNDITDLGRYLAWLLIGLGGSLILAIPIVRSRFEQYLAGLNAKSESI